MTLTNKLTKEKGLNYLLPLLMFSFVVFLNQKSTYALSVPCDNKMCAAYRAGYYSCQGQTFCCYKGGCPSACSQCGKCKNWVWSNCAKYKAIKHTTCVQYFWGVCTKWSTWYTYVCVPGSVCETTYPCICACVSCGSKDPPEPPAGNNAPNCSAITGTTTNIYAGSPPDGPFTYKATATDSDGTVASYTWSVNPAVGAFSSFVTTTNTNNWTPPADGGGAYTVNCTVADDDGATDACPALPITVISDFNLVVDAKLKNPIDACGANLTTLPNVNI
jgi:hypothetical protein